MWRWDIERDHVANYDWEDLTLTIAKAFPMLILTHVQVSWTTEENKWGGRNVMITEDTGGLMA